jgi:5'-nucleotidase (lipoprotein e(P4) family)
MISDCTAESTVELLFYLCENSTQMKFNLSLVSALALTIFVSCKTYHPTETPKAQPASLGQIDLNGKVYAAVFQQRSAEYKALCRQAYNIAAERLDQAVNQPHTKPLAIVSDIDETFLDNSPYAVAMAKKGRTYDEATWLDWASKGIAEPLAGSQEFYQYAASKRIEIFYITNRSVADKPGTIANLQKFRFPFADEAHVVVREQSSSKETRRQNVSETHEIVLLLGDNLADFSAAFDKKQENERSQSVTDNAAAFGKKFIILPNSGYGDWESALMKYNYKWTQAEKDSIYLNSVKGF